MKNVKQIIEEHLKRCGYDGLMATSGTECACLVDDLMPCEGDISGCVPGWKIHCGENCEVDGCAGDMDFHVVDYDPKKIDKGQPAQEEE